MQPRYLGVLISIIALMAIGAGASQVRQLEWDDLAKKIEFEDPFISLSQNQIYNLSIFAQVDALKKKDSNRLTSKMLGEAKEAEKALRAEDVDIEGLLSKRAEIIELRKKKAYSIVSELDGEQVRMPGFALPLEYSDKKITEFLLVPWVGACIHTPPPPPNQIVYVKIPGGFNSGGQFEPVWVNGELGVQSVQKNLFLKDGRSDIHAGYTLIANEISPYKQP